ncbi:gamma-crystallin N [Passer domesticus]|uniref:gamma-crystallin N n=1 Tax=Passer domesticus TaxID=48849 RepID=UPI0030FEF14E
MCTANRPKPCQANLLSDHLPKIKSPDSAGPVTGGSAYEAGKAKPPVAAALSESPGGTSPGRPPLGSPYIAGCAKGCPSPLRSGSRSWPWKTASRNVSILGKTVSLLLNTGPFSSSPQITFYEGKCFTGRKLDVCGSCNSFQDQGFLNRVNSICVQSGAWVCFDHPDFRGQQYILEHGEYPDFYRWNGRSDHLGSCRPVGMHGEHYRIEIFEGSHFRGPSLELTEDCSFLQGQGWDKACINALKVYGDGAWVLYEEPNYRGRMYVVERGEFGSFSEWQARSASVQSIRRVVNYF